MDTSVFIKLIKIIAILQILPFLIYGIDKLLAKMHLFRIPEKALLATTFFFGILGSIAGIMIFKHKSRKSSFQHNFSAVVLFRVIAMVSLVLIWNTG